MAEPHRYIGINNEPHGAMTPVCKIIRDAWVFGLLDESETCEGWNLAGIDALKHKVNDEWDKYGCIVSNLPEDLFERHKRIYDEAIKNAREAGWSGEAELEDDK